MITEENNNDMRLYAWNYFQLHASQRLTAFNFYIVISTVLGTGYLMSLKGDTISTIGIILGLLLSFLSFIFWKLDVRNKQMIKNAEDALKYLERQLNLENNNSNPHILQIFCYDESQAKMFKKSKSFWPWRSYYSYSKCFNLVFIILGVLGLLGTIYSAINTLVQ
jgi:hypothetical protein